MSLDLKLRLLGGIPIEVDKGVGRIKPLTVREIVDYGYTDYLMRLHFFTLELKDIIDADMSSEEFDITVFDIIVQNGNDDIKSELENALRLFLNEDRVEIDKEEHVVVIGEGDNVRYIDRDNFDNVREVIKWQNCINKFSEEDDSDNSNDSDAVKRIKERLKQSKEALKQAKQEADEEGGDIDLSDIISAVSSKSNSLNKINVYDLTLFQLYDEFKRLELIEQYDIGIKSMLAGAKDVKLKHWSTKIDW
jgi:hypothetical protein